MKENYYIACQSAEERSDGIVKLTEDEHKAVKKFLEQVYNFEGGYCGSCGIDEKGYSTEEEAQEVLWGDEEEYHTQDELSEIWHSMGRSE